MAISGERQLEGGCRYMSLRHTLLSYTGHSCRTRRYNLASSTDRSSTDRCACRQSSNIPRENSHLRWQVVSASRRDHLTIQHRGIASSHVQGSISPQCLLGLLSVLQDSTNGKHKLVMPSIQKPNLGLHWC